MKEETSRSAHNDARGGKSVIHGQSTSLTPQGVLPRCSSTQTLRIFRIYGGCCNENVTLKYNFALGCDYCTVVASCKIGEIHFRFLGTNAFHFKAENERFTTAGSRCRQNLKYENFTSSFGTLRQQIAPKSVLHVQHDYLS